MQFLHLLCHWCFKWSYDLYTIYTGSVAADDVKKMSERQTKAGNQECFAKLANLHNLQIDPWDMLNNFCFHVYAQKSLFINLQNLQTANCNAFFNWEPALGLANSQAAAAEVKM